MSKITRIQKEEIIKLIKQGYKTKDIANRFGINTSSISYVKEQYIIHGDKIFALDLNKGRKIESDDKKLIKKLQKENEELKLIHEHQKKFKTFIEEARKKESLK